MLQNLKEYRLDNIKIAKAFRTTSYETLSVLTRITPILIELGNRAKFYLIAREMNKKDSYDAPKDYRKWTHPAETIEMKEKCGRIEVYMDGSKIKNGVGSEIAIFFDKHLNFQLK